MADRTINILSLCTGGGGLDRGAELALRSLGYEARVVCGVERDAFACEVLARTMEAGGVAPFPVWSDLRTFDGRPWRGVVDLVTAGIPCQGNSLAGKRMLADDERDLWSDTARILRELSEDGHRVSLLLENVFGFLVPDRAGNREAPVRRVLRELAEMGWDAEWCVLPASAVGASHRRERVFVLAHGPSGGFGECGESSGRDGQSDVGDAASPRRGRGAIAEELERSAICGGMPCKRSEQLAHAAGNGRSQHKRRARQGDESDVEDLRRAAVGDDRTGLRLFAPGPGLGSSGFLDDIRELLRTDRRAAWRRFDAERRNTAEWVRSIALAPSLEPAVRGVADGVAGTRREWLRVLGNGVVDLQAAAALRALVDAFGGEW